MSCTNNTGRIFATLITGVAIGGILGVLYAPAKGCETRQKLSCKAEEADALTESLKIKFNDLIEEIRRDVEDARNNHNELA